MKKYLVAILTIVLLVTFNSTVAFGAQSEDLYAFDSIDVGLEVVSSYVSGLKELCLRPDFYQALQGI